MAKFDRTGMIELLRRLGSESDAEVLAAAREVHKGVTELGISWDELLQDAADDGTGIAPAGEAAAEPAPAPLDRSPDGRLIERLLARKDISAELRKDLKDFRTAVAKNTLDAMDRDYIRALAKRLGT